MNSSFSSCESICATGSMVYSRSTSGFLRAVRAEVIVGADDQVVLGVSAVSEMLLQVLERGDLAVVVVAGDA